MVGFYSCPPLDLFPPRFWSLIKALTVVEFRAWPLSLKSQYAISAESKCDLDDGQQRFNDSSMTRKQHHGRLVQLDTTDMYNADTT